MNKILLQTYIGTAILGLIDASFLTYNRFMHVPPPCGIGIFSGCAIVDRSPYSVMFGIPLSVFGMIFYILGIIAALLVLYSRYTFRKYILGLVSVAGALSSMYFIYLQAYVIHAFCIYCLFSALCTFVLLGLSFLVYKNLPDTVS
jgi:uncharacterized membrane protein